jgi:transposase-like protein
MGNRVYSEELKCAACERVSVGRHTIAEVAKRLGVNYQSLRQWVMDALSSSAISTVPKELRLEQRYRDLGKKNLRLRVKRDIINKRRHTSRRSSCEVYLHS